MAQTNYKFEKTQPASTVLPLCIDLDGTLVMTNTLHENILALVDNPMALAAIPRWLVAGKGVLKQELARRVEFDPTLLPYNLPLLDYLQKEKRRGRYLVLVTAADSRIAEAVNRHLRLFDEVMASDGVNNLRGEAKAAALADRFGPQGFVYAGNDSTDLAVWREAAKAILVNAPVRVARAAATITAIEAEIDARPAILPACVKALRPYQWVKNLLVFVPLITANALTDAGGWLCALLLFVAFCAMASGIYLVNDLADLTADRRHPRKCNRPFASGALPIWVGVLLAPILFLAGTGFALMSRTTWIVLLYGVMSITYTFWLKQLLLIDLFALSGLYTVRLFAGGGAAGHPVSMWLLAFSSFLFLSLALVKRVCELMVVKSRNEPTATRRDYLVGDLPALQVMGISASFVSALVLTLYVQDEAVRARYTQPELLWSIVPLMLFWQCRLWIVTARGYMHDDPIVYAAKDRVSRIIGVLLILVLLLASTSF